MFTMYKKKSLEERVQLFTVVLIAILLEGFTFLLLGSCLSGIIEIFLSPVCSVSLSYFAVYHASGWQIPPISGRVMAC